MSYVLTLALDAEAQERFERLRQQHFPPELNRVPAHLSLFHTLPETPEIHAALQAVASATSAFPLHFNAIRSLGRGVAYFAESVDAARLQRTLREAFEPHLTPQDRQGFRPHVVVQNKTSAVHARETLALLSAAFVPFQCISAGLDLWRYLNGPWQHVERFPFRT